MEWFKFYGAEFLSDPKVFALSPSERGVFITLLSLASMAGNDLGQVEYLTAERLAAASGADPSDEEWDISVGTLEKLQRLKIIEIESNGTVTILNWRKRQERYLSNAERQKRHREKQKRNAEVTQDSNKSNARIEKNRNNTAAKPQTTMKKNRMGSYREDAPQDSYDESIDLDTGEAVKPKERAGVLPAYKELVDWSQTRRGFKFLSIPKQYKAFKEAKTFGLMPADLKKRWLELEEDKFYAEKGFDWPTVVYSFNRKQK